MVFRGFLSSLIFCYFFSYMFLYYIKHISSRKIFIVLLFLFVLRYVVELYIKKYSSIFCVDLYCHPVIRFMEYGIALCLGVVLRRTKNNLSKNVYIFSGLEIFLVIIYIFIIIYFDKQISRSIFVLLTSFMIFVFSFDRGIISNFYVPCSGHKICLAFY